jgi:hypothetical protein
MKDSIYAWLRLLWGKSVDLALTSVVTVVLYAGLLYLVNFFWMVYIETPVGKRFVAHHVADIAVIEGLRGENFFLLSLGVILAFIAACLVFGAVSRVFLLLRYFHEGRGFLYRLILWGIPCAGLTAVAISRAYEIGLVASFLFGVGPSMALFDKCLRFTPGLLPEISGAFGGLATLIRKGFERDRRTEPRYELYLPLTYYGPKSSEVQKGTAYQISNHGFCVQEHKDLVNDDLIRFKLRVEDESVRGEATIKWTKDLDTAERKKAQPSRSGCRIVSMATKYRGVLRDYLSRHSFAGA